MMSASDFSLRAAAFSFWMKLSGSSSATSSRQPDAPSRSPAADHAVLVLDDVILIAAVALIDLRERVDAPPRTVLVRPVVKVEPAEIRRFLGLERAYAVIMAACVEIAAVVAGVIEHAVQYNAHAASGGFAAQRTEVLLTAEQRSMRL